MKKILSMLLATALTVGATNGTASADLIKGDAFADGKLSVADARKIVVAIAKGETDKILSADMNGDGKITVADARKLVVAIAKGEYELTTQGHMADFALDLFKYAYGTDENALVNPLTASMVTAMLTDGAVGDTSAELQNIYGTDFDNISEYLANYTKSLESDTQLTVANSAWVRDNLSAKDEYLNALSQNYGAEIFKNKAFDNSTIREINQWVSEKTGGVINNSLEDNFFSNISKLFINSSSAFNAVWDNRFIDDLTVKGTFKSADGTEQTVDMMSETLAPVYDAPNATLFKKDYENKRYTFVAALPHEDITLKDYINSLDTQKFMATLNANAVAAKDVIIPKFSVSSEVDLAGFLNQQGVEKAFDFKTSDFSNIADEDLFVNVAKQNNVFEIDENGTKAASTSMIEVATGVSNGKLVFDRPFMYMIIDNATELPVYIGTVSNVK